MIELLVAVALLGILLLVGARYTRPVQSPVRQAVDQLSGTIQEARALAMSRTRVHRIRPVTDQKLIIESAVTCGAASWDHDPHHDLLLSDPVQLDGTAWSVCFNTQGIASNNIIVNVSHPGVAAASLEVLAGGAVRKLSDP